MTETRLSKLNTTLQRLLTQPNPTDLWELQVDLLALQRPEIEPAREVAGEFYSFLQNLESKIASRSASRWGAVLETSSVTSVSLQEMLAEQDNPLRRILASGVTAALEVAAAAKNVQAWEVEASLMYFDLAWYLYGELWQVSQEARPELSPSERRADIDRLLEPIRNPNTADTIKSALLVRLFQVVLAARVWPLLKQQG